MVEAAPESPPACEGHAPIAPTRHAVRHRRAVVRRARDRPGSRACDRKPHRYPLDRSSGRHCTGAHLVATRRTGQRSVSSAIHRPQRTRRATSGRMAVPGTACRLAPVSGSPERASVQGNVPALLSGCRRTGWTAIPVTALNPQRIGVTPELPMARDQQSIAGRFMHSGRRSHGRPVSTRTGDPVAPRTPACVVIVAALACFGFVSGLCSNRRSGNAGSVSHRAVR